MEKNEREPEHKPGDLIINRYMPNATPEQKEEARENLRALALVLLRMNNRLKREAEEKSSPS